MLNINVSGNVEEVLSDLQRLMPALLNGTPLPPMQEQPARDPEPVKPRSKKKDELAPLVKDAATSSTATDPNDAANAKETASSDASKPEVSSGSVSTASPVDLDDVRAKLKTLGATDGLGHDKVFELLGKYGAKNASTVPEDKRADLIADIDAALASVK